MATAMQEDGTVKAAANFNAERDAEVLRKAMKGLGTDEKAIIDILGYRNNAQRQEIKSMFKTMYGRDLTHDLKSELGGKFEDVVVGVMMTPAHFDATSMREAMKGAGTDEDCLIEILATRTNAEINNAKAAYKTLFKRDLEKDLKSETSGNFERLLVSLANASRRENQPVDMEQAKRHAQELYGAGEKRWGTDESTFNKVLCSQSYEQLRVVFEEYRKISNRTMEQVIKSEMSGDLEDGMLALVKCVQTRQAYFAEVLYKSMKGLGTNDRQLVRAVVSRCEVDMVQIKQQFQARYGQSLEKFIEDDCSGDYKRMLLALVRTK